MSARGMISFLYISDWTGMIMPVGGLLVRFCLQDLQKYTQVFWYDRGRPYSEIIEYACEGHDIISDGTGMIMPLGGILVTFCVQDPQKYTQVFGMTVLD